MSRSGSSSRSRRASACRRTIRRFRRRISRWPAFSSVLKAWKREPAPARPDNTSIRTPASCCCTSRWSAGSACPTRLCWREAAAPARALLNDAAGSGRTLRRKFAPALRGRVVQGYSETGRAARQAWRRARPLLLAGKRAAVFLGARHGVIPGRAFGRANRRPVAAGGDRNHRIARSPRFARTSPRLMHGRHITDRTTILDKNGGLSNSTTYIGMIPSQAPRGCHSHQSRLARRARDRPSHFASHWAEQMTHASRRAYRVCSWKREADQRPGQYLYDRGSVAQDPRPALLGA